MLWGFSRFHRTQTHTHTRIHRNFPLLKRTKPNTAYYHIRIEDRVNTYAHTRANTHARTVSLPRLPSSPPPMRASHVTLLFCPALAKMGGVSLLLPLPACRLCKHPISPRSILFPLLVRYRCLARLLMLLSRVVFFRLHLLFFSRLFLKII